MIQPWVVVEKLYYLIVFISFFSFLFGVLVPTNSNSSYSLSLIMFVSKSTLNSVLGTLPVQVQPISYRRRQGEEGGVAEGDSMVGFINSGQSFSVEPIVGELTTGDVVLVVAGCWWFREVTRTPPRYIIKRVAEIRVSCSVVFDLSCSIELNFANLFILLFILSSTMVLYISLVIMHLRVGIVDYLVGLVLVVLLALLRMKGGD